MPSLLRARTEIVDVEVFTHSPATPTTACEWWRRSCIGFASGGMWEVRSRRGHAVLGPGRLLADRGSWRPSGSPPMSCSGTGPAVPVRVR